MISGLIIAFPLTTVRIASARFFMEIPFRRYPLAPYFKAPKIYSSSSNVVSTIIEISGYFSFTRRVHSTPSIPGIRISINITLGFPFFISESTCSPFSAVPVTSISSFAPRTIFKLSRISS